MEILCERTTSNNRYLELETDVGLKSRMRENCTYGSVRGSRQAFHVEFMKGVSRLSTRRKPMKRLPESELEIMMIIWRHDGPVNRMEIEAGLEKKVAAPTVLSFLNRLEAKGFVRVEKIGKVNWYTPLVEEEAYLQRESKNILQKLYRNSLKNFVAALYDGDALTQQDMEELADFLEKKGQGIAGKEAEKVQRDTET